MKFLGYTLRDLSELIRLLDFHSEDRYSPQNPPPLLVRKPDGFLVLVIFIRFRLDLSILIMSQLVALRMLFTALGKKL